MRRMIATIALLAAWTRAEWKPLPMPPFDANGRDTIWSVAAYGNALWAMTSDGLFRSADSGRDWRPVRPPGFPRYPRYLSSGGSLHSLAGCLYATTVATGLSYTCDGGSTWKSAGPSGAPGTSGLFGVTRLEGDSALLFAEVSGSRAISMSTDRGLTWRKTPPAFPSGMELEAVFQEGSRLWLSAGFPYASDDGGQSWKPAGVPTGKVFAKQLGMLWVTRPLCASGDGGESWEPRDIPLPGLLGSYEASTLVSAGGRLFTSGRGEMYRPLGVFMSSDTGKTWVSRNQGLPASDFDLDSSVTDAYAVHAVGGVLLAQTSRGIYRSENLGADWRPSNAGLPSAAARDFNPELVYPYGGRIYARAGGGAGYAWYVSGDTARTWQAWRPGIPGLEYLAFSASGVFAFRSHPDSQFADPVYRSVDGMASWSPVRGPWSDEAYPLRPSAVFASGSHVWVASAFILGNNGVETGYWHSPDEGATWKTDTVLSRVKAFQWEASAGDIRFRIDEFEAHYSEDGGRSWTAAPAAVAGAIRDVAILDRTVFILAAGADNAMRISASADGGKTWRSALPGAGGPGANGMALFAGRVYAATSAGLRVSRNGSDWEDLGEAGLSRPGVTLVAASQGNLVARTNLGLHYSSDWGAHWQASAPGYPGDLKWLAARKNVFFAGSPVSGIWSSPDTGRTWTRMYGVGLMGMWAGPDDLVLAGRDGRIQDRPDGNGPWTAWTEVPGLVNDLAALAMAEGGLYLSKPDGGFVSRGPASPWSAAAFPGKGPHDLLAGDGRTLAVASAEGIYSRPSSQAPWQSLGDGLPEAEVSALAMDEGRLFAAMSSRGLWVNADLPMAARPAAGEAFHPGGPAILSGADGSPIFRLRLTRPAEIRLSLHGATGRALASFTGAVPAGAQDVKPPIRGPGAVFYRLEVRPTGGKGEGPVFRGRIP